VQRYYYLPAQTYDDIRTMLQSGAATAAA